jgi:hypothetical protein
MHEDWDGSAADNLISDAAEKQSRQTAATMRLQSDQIVLAACRLIQDRRGRMGMDDDTYQCGDSLIVQ